MKVNFPNRLGHASTSPEQVDLLSSQFGFSAAYSDFLKNQNGFNFSDLESISETAEILTGDPESSEGKSDLRVLYSIGTEDPYYDLEIKISDPFATFGGAFFPIGEGYGGNLFVEVLHGEKKGYIASLDHELYASSSDFEDFLEEFDLPTNGQTAELADALMDDELGLAWIHAESFERFIDSGVRVDEDMTGFAEDLLSDT